MHVRFADWTLRLLSMVIITLLLLTFMPSALAMEPTSIAINKGWRFRALNDKGHPGVERWHRAEVPGVVQTDLLHNKLIPDPFYGDNEPTLQWIGLTDWEYETEFEVTPALLGRGHLELLFAGLDTYADVFLNGTQILTADNMFRHWRVPVKDKLHAGSNKLRVVFHSPVMYMLPTVKALPYRLPTVSQVLTVTEEGIATDPYTRKAPYNYGWDWGPRYVTEGIWLPVELYAWDDVRIDNFHIHQAKVTEANAKLSAELDVLAEAPEDVEVRVEYAEENNPTQSPKAGDKGAQQRIVRGVTQKVHLEAGMNHVSIPFDITKPDRWYPNGYGAQALYRFTATVRRGKTTEDGSQVRTGLRSLELRRVPDQWGKSFEFVVNGIPVFMKGADVIPFDSFAPRVTPEQHRYILQSAKDAHMNMIRAWGGGYYETDDFYDICDELGIMVWQDFMFGGAMVPGDLPYQENVREEAKEQVKRLRDHPSLALWNGNNEVETGWKNWGDRQAFKESISPTERERVWQDYLVMFHDIIKSVVREYGDGTPYWPSSPSSNFEPNPDGQSNGDMHYWAVWHALAPISDYTKQFPRFMSEYGFQSFPEMRTIRQFAGPKDLDLLSPVMQEHQKNVGGNERIRTYMLREYHEPKDFESFIYVSQVMQAEAIKVGAEHLRRQRPRTMGSLYWQLNDCWPVASWSSIDYYGRWKALQYYARRFYDDLLVSPVEVDGIISAFVVSDKLQATPAELRVRVMDFSGKQMFEDTKTVTVPELSSKIYATYKREDLLKGTDAQHAFAVFELSAGGQVVSRNLLMFDITRNLALPSPQIQAEFSGTNGEYSVRLHSAVLARHVYLSFGNLDVTVSDNYFDLLPNEPVNITLKSKAGLEEIKRELRIRNITDAFLPAEAKQ